MKKLPEIDGISVHCAHAKIEPVGKPKPYPKNNKTHPEAQIELMCKAIKEQGWRAPITVSNQTGYIVRGHARLEAAKRLGLKHVPVDYQSYASEAAERIDRIADNKLAELAEWNLPNVKDEFEELDGGDLDKEGAIQYLKQDDLTVINPLLGWTDTMITRYAQAHNLPQHPLKAAGALTIGCIYCGGGAQFDNSGFRVLRHTDPVAFRRMLIEFDFAPVILAIKYDVHIDIARNAIRDLGGVDALIKTRPFVFDFLKTKPLKGYQR